ncbi:MAG TPA: hypothetical protein VN784_14505 [Candidatus Limnocylindrales bacterium]|nr:hypothetical protein [Candidatus Limnocylindrales bacterium]
MNAAFHCGFRELLLHAAAREGLLCPAYCLMPDHIHLLWLGLRCDTDQRNAMSFLRTHLEPRLAPHKFQPQAHDHVLSDEERKHDAFARICFYILANPVRAGLIAAGDSRGRRKESSLVTSAPTEDGRGRRGESSLVTSAPTEDGRGRRKESSLVTSAPTEDGRGRRGESSLVTSAPTDWPYGGAIVPGYPTLHPWQEDFWPKFWKLYQRQRQPEAGDRKLPFRSSRKTR